MHRQAMRFINRCRLSNIAILPLVSSMYVLSLVRGIGIPLFSACATLAVMGAVSAGKSGLAAGPLGMARNIGTALGVAMLGQVFLDQVERTLADCLRFLPAHQVALGRAAAAQIFGVGAGRSQLTAGQAIDPALATARLA